MSPVLRCYGDTDAITPNIDKLALESIKFTNAFSSAPVCSPSRSCLIQEHFPRVWVPSICVRGSPSPSFTGFPSLLRKDGYYTTNNVKTDYNSGNYQQIIEKSWNESSSTAHWRKRERKTCHSSVSST